MTKTTEQVREEVLATLRAAVQEAHELSERRSNGYVCFFADCLSPFRTNNAIIALCGGRVWVADSYYTARRTARILSAKAGEGRAVVCDRVDVWANRRITELNRMISQLQA